MRDAVSYSYSRFYDSHDRCSVFVRAWPGISSAAAVVVDAKVKLVISGHTHDYLWMPAKEGQPIAQLIGGAPRVSHATWICGEATQDKLRLKMTKLDGTVLTNVEL